MNRQPLFYVALATTFITASCQRVPQMPDNPEPKMIAELAKPATILIQTTYNADLSVPSVAMNEAAFADLSQRVYNAQLQGAQQDELLDAVIQEILGNFEHYFYASPPMRSVNARIDAVGSGFFVTDDGYVVTNAHVVSDNADNLRVALAQNALAQLIEQDVQDFVSELGGAATEEHITKLREVAANFYAQNMQIGEIQRAVVVHLGANLPGVAETTKPVQAEVMTNAVGEPIPGKDVAILKIAATDCPTLELGDDTTVDVGEPLYPYGFPADATFFPAFDASSINEPSLTQGLASARKKMQGGWDVIQTDAAIRGGNSGGPVLDQHGKVIGLSTFGLVEQDSGASAQGANFIVPTSVVKEFLQRANVQPKSSKTTELWREAVLLRSEGRHSEAVERLETLVALRPGTPVFHARLQESKKAILDGNDKGGSPTLLYVLVGIAAVVVLVVLAKLMKGGGKPRPLNLPPVQSGPPTLPGSGHEPPLSAGDEDSSKPPQST